MANYHKNTVRKLFDRLKGEHASKAARQGRVDTVPIDELEDTQTQDDSRIETEILRRRITEQLDSTKKEDQSSK